MSESDQIKVCPLCAETIKAAAKVCPHCRHWQKRWSLQNPQVGALLWVVLCIAGMAALGGFVERTFGPKRNFAEYQNQISVVESHMSHRVAGSNLLVTVVGTLTNQSVHSWRSVTLEAQFFDENGKLIDVVSQVGDYGGVTVVPHGKAGFKIEGKAARPESNYATNTVFVRWAKDVDAWP